MATNPIYLDIELPATGKFHEAVTVGHNAFLYVFGGPVTIQNKNIPQQHAGILSDGNKVEVQAGKDGARFLLLAGKPLNKPIVKYAPFVMNTMEEVEQAIRDYRGGTLTNYG